MTRALSARLAAIVEALPLRPGIRVLEIGCGPGAAARAIAQRIGDVRELASSEIAAGRMSVRQVAVEHFALEPGEAPFDIAFAVRVGALDGRHPELQHRALHASVLSM